MAQRDKLDESQLDELCLWLGIATRGLCDEAKERVYAEIRSHHAEAVAEELGQGRTLCQAHRQAMAALGDPWSARKAYRRAYLTREEVRQWDRVRKSLSSRRLDHLFKFVLFLCGLALAGHVLLWWIYGEGESIWSLARGVRQTALYWGCPSLLVVDRCLVRSYIGRRGMTLPVLLYLINFALLASGLTLAILIIAAGEGAPTCTADSLAIDVHMAASLAGVLGVQLMFLLLRLRILRKLGRNHLYDG